MIEQWLLEQPDASAKELFLKLQDSVQKPFHPGQLRTLQRRVKAWRSEVARQLVFNAQLDAAEEINDPALVAP
jgi:hypothetical protein